MENKLASKKNEIIKHISLCLLGSLILAFSTAAFLIPADIVAGGVSGIGIIINHFIEPQIHYNVTSYIVLICNIIAFILAIIFLGKKFTLNTLISTFAYPLFLILFTYTPIISFIVNEFKVTSGDKFVMAGIFGGLGVGIAVSLTFLGEGSTGGVDVLAFIITKYTKLKQSISSFLIDATIILLGLLVTKGQIYPTLIGALSSFLTAVVIHVLYDQANPVCIVEIITDKYVEITKYTIDVLDRTTTTFNITGGYSKEEKKLIRVVISKKELILLKDKIREIDSKAFITVTNATRVLGQGFTLLDKSKSFSLFGKKNKDKTK